MSDVRAYRLMTSYHQFHLTGDGGEDVGELHAPDDDGLVFADSGHLVVRCGAYAAPVEVGLEPREANPGEPQPDWEDVVELSARCIDRILMSELMAAPKAVLVAQPGWFRLRVSARGRDAGAERGEVGRRAKIVEHYLIQAWPAPPDAGTTYSATSLRPVDHTAGRIHLAAGRAAAERINADLDQAPGHRALPGATGSVQVQWTYPTTRRKLFHHMARLDDWSSASGSGRPGIEVGTRYWLSGNRYRDIFDGIPTGTRGHVGATLAEVDRPNSVTIRWEWRDSPSHGRGKLSLDRPTTLTIRLTQATAPDGRPETTVHLQHDDLPVEWLDDMRTVWLCKFEAGDRVFALAR